LGVERREDRDELDAFAFVINAHGPVSVLPWLVKAKLAVSARANGSGLILDGGLSGPHAQGGQGVESSLHVQELRALGGFELLCFFRDLPSTPPT
jgi:hypothetical protein